MIFRLLVSILGLFISGVLSITSVDASVFTDQKTTKYTNYSYFRIHKLHTQQKKGGEENFPKKCPEKSYQNHFPCLSVGPYLHKIPAFDGSDLIISIPTVREDAHLILLQQQLAREYHQLGLTIPDTPIVIISGKLEAQTSYESSYTVGASADMNLKSANINFSGVELDTYAQVSPWVSGYIALDYDPEKPQQRDSLVFMNRAFIIIGNLSQFPVYASIGQVYVPFGRYNSMMITAPVTQVLGRTRARAITLGYQQTGSNALHAEIYGYQGILNNAHTKYNNNEWGADIGYEFTDNHCISGEIGASFISNLADSQGMQSVTFLHDGNFRHLIPVMGMYGSLVIKPVAFVAEYISSLKNFEIDDIDFKNKIIYPRPAAFHMETSYTFRKALKRLGSIGMGYGHTSQSLAALSVPQDRYSVFYSVNIWKDTNFSLEYHYDVNYIRNIILMDANKKLVNLINGINKKIDNAVTAQFDLYF